MDKNEIYSDKFIKPIVYWGRLTNILAAFLALVPAVYLWLVFGALPPVSAIIAGSASVVFGFAGVLWFVEPISYFPILGIPGTYMSFLSGNIPYMRVPCSAIAQESAGVEEGSQEGAIISVFGVGVSVFLNTAVMLVGAIVGAQLVAIFPPIVKSALSYILPAVFGGVFGQFAAKNYKIAGISLALGLILNLLGLAQTIAMPAGVFITMFIGIQLVKMAKAKSTPQS